MTIKSAALLALIGTVLLTVVLASAFIFHLVNVLRDVEASVILLSSFVYAFGAFTLAVFFFVFYRSER